MRKIFIITQACTVAESKKILSFPQKLLMELQILVENENSARAAIHLKDFIDNASIEGVKNTEIERAPRKEGEMGLGNLLSSVKTLIDAAQQPLTELVKCLQLYVGNYRTEITIKTKDIEVQLNKGRNMSSKEIEELVSAIQKSNSTAQ